MKYRQNLLVNIMIFALTFSTIPLAYGGNFQGAGGSSDGSKSYNEGDSSSEGNNSSSSKEKNQNQKKNKTKQNKMTKAEARKEAESEIAPTATVYNVTDPAVVYSQLRPYVDEWRNSMSVPTNKWGVDTSSSVVISSTRPDYVPAELITFIMGKLAKDNKAGAFGLDGTAETRKNLEKARKDKVEKRANEILDKANEESSDSSSSDSGGSQSENSNNDDSDSDKPDSDKPDQIDPEPVTSESEHAAGIDQDLDGKPDGMEDESDNSAPDETEHKASFLLDNADTRVMNLLSPKLDKIEEVTKRLLDNGDDTIYLYLSNGGDGEGSGYSCYDDGKFGQSLNEESCAQMKKKVEEIKAKGLNIIFWLRADESTEFNRLSSDIQQTYQKEMVDLFGNYTSGWVLGLEIDEYFRQEEVAILMKHLKSITSKPVGIHCTNLEHYEWALTSKADVFYGQYGFGLSPEEIAEKTRAVVKKLDGKAKFIAAEYHKSSDSEEAKALGRAAMEAGADGTGNGR